MLDDHANGNKASSKVYRDDQPDDIEGLPDSAPHRNVDLIISRAAYQLHSKDQRIAIILPPTIYGEGTGPANTVSQKTPGNSPTFVILADESSLAPEVDSDPCVDRGCHEGRQRRGRRSRQEHLVHS